ncbi:MAG TPA: glyoxalase/bleomycin resistance/dioxygenase family protein [Cytophagales bacterium]|nr:glyoxalase/bleomycin resistance/dioxygenase family protein [Cytophagales bacterium]HAA23186.1 glyoxalase/bleomycin resistance/dioxygenase family protein [Cytophagales bacterium]HAP59306.1 glyoxalase/bleomycin resistance/dioxygenase family protein [Cytophagales bacterium]
MNIQQTGFILYTIRYHECVQFYEHTLGLPVLYRKETLTCFDFHGSYLMVEIDDETGLTELETPVRDRTCIRINVADVKAACARLDAANIPYSYGEYDWGTVAKFRDPEGNLIGFRSANEHQQDLKQV